MQDLGTLGGTTSAAYDATNGGSIVGRSLTSSNAYTAALWENSGGGFNAYRLRASSTMV